MFKECLRKLGRGSDRGRGFSAESSSQLAAPVGDSDAASRRRRLGEHTAPRYADRQLRYGRTVGVGRGEGGEKSLSATATWGRARPATCYSARSQPPSHDIANPFIASKYRLNTRSHDREWSEIGYDSPGMCGRLGHRDVIAVNWICLPQCIDPLKYVADLLGGI